MRPSLRAGEAPKNPMHRTAVLGTLALCAAVFAVLCADLSCSSSPPAQASGAFSPACLHYASHVTGGQCGAPALPATEVARVTPRWAQHCEDILAMPGSSITAAALDQCLTLLEAGDCWSANPPDVCLSSGTLPANAACNQNGLQCQSGSCLGTIAQAPCGTCVASAAVGQPCDPTQAENLCVLGSSCVTSTTAATGATCVAVTLGAPGATCAQSSDCATGLICDPTTLKCAKPPGVGAACSDPFSCAYPLVCNVTDDAGTTCQPAGVAGAPCLYDEYCVKGLGCSTAGGTCGPISWQTAGQPCDGDLARCLVGDCPATQAPVCPTILEDGAACTSGDATQTCDVGAVCFNGKCVSGSSVVCK